MYAKTVHKFKFQFYDIRKIYFTLKKIFDICDILCTYILIMICVSYIKKRIQCWGGRVE